MRVVALAGGVGGAKLADGLAQILQPEDLTIIVNIGDDFEHLGLKICPDLDTVCYTLAGMANPNTGWGIVGETWNALESINVLGGPSWFRLGDRDLGTHLERSRRLHGGQPLSQVTRDFCQAWGVAHTVLPVSDDPVPTWVDTEDEGELLFQEYFVHRQCHPCVTGFRFAGASDASPAPGVIEALENAHVVVICPSNPWVSIGPILSIPGVQSSLKQPVIAVSPIIGGQAVKGPAAKMYIELGFQPTALTVANHYNELLSGFVLDREDASLAEDVRRSHIQPFVTNTLMHTPEDRRQLAYEVLYFARSLHS